MEEFMCPDELLGGGRSRTSQLWKVLILCVYIPFTRGSNKYSNLGTFERNKTCVAHNQRIYSNGKMNYLPAGNRRWIFYVFSFCNSRDMFPAGYGSFWGEPVSCLHCGVAQCVIEGSEFYSNSNYFDFSQLAHNDLKIFVQLLFFLYLS